MIDVAAEAVGVVAAAAAVVGAFLVTVGDAEGLSYYSDRSLCQALNLSEGDLAAARRRLMEEDLLDWEAPFYQVLSVPERRTA